MMIDTETDPHKLMKFGEEQLHSDPTTTQKDEAIFYALVAIWQELRYTEYMNDWRARNL